MKFPTTKLLKKATQPNAWDFGNKILYNLCSNNFNHKRPEHIIAKVLFIGRIYAAAIERRKIKKESINDTFYLNTVVSTFRKSQLDKHLKKLRKIEYLSIHNLELVLLTHGYLTSKIKEITDLNKRSFVSKYLHFHLPKLFYIYDSRAASAMQKFTTRVPKDLKHLLQLDGVDKQYASFCCKCFDLNRTIKLRYKTGLTPRELDKLLIEFSNKKNELKYQ